MFGASSAASEQKKAAQIAANTQLQMYGQTRSDLAPYRDLGAAAGAQLQNRLTDLTTPVTMDQATLEATPGYQFNLSQGLKAAQSSAAARGLGLSGAAIKAATGYATGLADSTYQNQFSNAVTNATNSFNRLYQATGLGQSAAAGQATANLLTGAGVAKSQTGAGDAAGAASIAGGNAIGSAGNSLGQLLSQYLNGSNKLTSMFATDSPDLSVGSDASWV